MDSMDDETRGDTRLSDGRLAIPLGRLVRLALVQGACALVGSVVPFLAAAGLVWYAAAPAQTSASLAAAVLLAVCFGLAGVAWGIRRVACSALSAASERFLEEAPRLVDLALSRLASRLPAPDARLEIASLRRAWDDVVGRVFDGGESLPGPLAPAARLARWSAGRVFRARAARLAQVFSALEERGETHVTAEALREWFRDKLVELAARDTRRRIRIVSLCGGVVTGLLVALPLCVLFWMRYRL